VRKLTLSEWGNIAEVISAGAVVVSLLYVGYQVSENTGEIRAANRQQLVNRSHSASLLMATNKDLATVLAKATAGEPMDGTERRQLASAIRAVLYDTQEAFLLNREGRVDEGYWATRGALVSLYLANPASRSAYDEMKSRGLLLGDFTAWVDGIIGAVQRQDISNE